MKGHRAAYILHPEAFVQDFLQLVDIISWIGQNKNTLDKLQICIDDFGSFPYTYKISFEESIEFENSALGFKMSLFWP